MILFRTTVPKTIATTAAWQAKGSFPVTVKKLDSVLVCAESTFPNQRTYVRAELGPLLA